MYEIIMMHADQIDASFEFWLTVSFGVLIAIHVLKAALVPKIKMVLCGLYVSASLIAIIFTLTDLLQIVRLTAELSFELDGGPLNALGTLIRFLVYLVGTTSVAIAIFRYGEWIESIDT